MESIKSERHRYHHPQILYNLGDKAQRKRKRETEKENKANTDTNLISSRIHYLIFIINTKISI